MIFFNIFIKLLSIFVWIAIKVECIPSIIRVGGLFTAEQEEQELAFRFAVDKINEDKIILPGSTLIAQVERVDNFDFFLTQQKVCGLLRNSVVAIFGPQEDITSMHVQSICENYEMPHIEARLDHDWHRSKLMVNLYPQPHQLAEVYMDLIRQWEWTSFAIIYDNPEGIVHLKDFFDVEQNHTWRDNIKLFQLRDDTSYRDVLWQVKRSGEHNVVFHVKTENLIEAFENAQQVSLMTENHNFLITSLDLLTLDLERFRHSGTNITSLRVYNEKNYDYQSLFQQWPVYASRLNQRHLMIPPLDFKAESVLLYDAVKVLATALKELNQFYVPQINCDEEEPWSYGSSLINYMRKIWLRDLEQGITHEIKFDESGLRSTFLFDIISITEEEFDVVGTWSSDRHSKLKLHRHQPEWNKHYSKTRLRVDDTNRKLVIVTKIQKPFTQPKEVKEALDGNARYEGYCIDLADALAREMNFEYEILIVKSSGSYNKTTGKWTGMMGAVIDGVADMAISDVSVNSQREKAVDFTLPFMSTGISIIYKKPLMATPSLWSFLSPFSIKVWMYLLATFGGVSVILFLTGRFSPYEWGSTHPCRQDDKVLENDLNIRNSFWCTIGSLMQQGSDIAPKAMSTRVIIAIWYFFTLIMVSSYTANLAAFLTTETPTYPFSDAEGLAKNTQGIKYGCYPDGATHNFFRTSNVSIYKKIGNFLDAHPELLMSSNDEALKKVNDENGKYAYFMEGAHIEYWIERNCTLTQRGNLLDNKGYAIATRKGSPLRNLLSQTILQLQEKGVLTQLKQRWWKERGGGRCDTPPPPQIELTLKNLGGVFLVLAIGSVVAIMMAVCEFFYKTKKDNKQMKYLEDLKFAMTCYESSKPTRSKSRSQKSLTGSRSFIGSKGGSTPGLNSQLSGIF